MFVYAQAPARLSGVEDYLEVAVSSTVAVTVRGDYLKGAQSDGVALSFMPFLVSPLADGAH